MKQLDFNFYLKKKNDSGYNKYKKFLSLNKVWDARRFCEDNLEKRIFEPLNCHLPSARTLRNHGISMPLNLKEVKTYLKEIYPDSKKDIIKMNAKQAYSTFKIINWFNVLGKEYCSFKGYI